MGKDRQIEREIEFGYRYVSQNFQQALDTLTPRQREVAILVLLLGYTHEEVAEHFGCVRQSVTQTLDRAKHKLRETFHGPKNIFQLTVAKSPASCP